MWIIPRLVIVAGLLSQVYLQENEVGERNIRTFRQLFSRQPNTRLSSLPIQQIGDTRVEGCAEACVKATEFRCKSFDYNNDKVLCLLYEVGDDDYDVTTIESPNTDHYTSAYTFLFKKLPNHKLNTWINRKLEGASVEQCARRCILATDFKCEGFNYHHGHETCLMTSTTVAANGHGVIIDDLHDYYQRAAREALDNFINYGHMMMRPLVRAEVYQKILMGVHVQDCADRCMSEQTFDCLSFDYVYMGERSQCKLSKYIAANVYGLTPSDTSIMVNHFELIEKYLRYFYATPYSVILGNNIKTFKHVTPNRCARMCMEEAGFVCRSFDYQINEGTCILSSKTGSDVGGLYSGPLQQTSSEQQVHHFEMKPVLDCGGNLTSEHGNLASPGWPRNYVHHEHCMWNIRVQQFKIIHIKFMHFELGLQSSDACNPQDDRLEVSEPGVVPYCVMPNVRDIKSRGNEMTLTFVTNGERDGQGFRAFYASEWTCDAHFDESPGQFASPNWPENYPSGQRCMWRITAPSNQRVKVLFTSFKLEEHPLGHCSDDLDHVKVLDGGTITSPKIGLYCNSQYHLTLRSTGREMLVQFVSDEDKTREGFHASFVFESVNGTATSDGDLGIIGIVDLDKEPTAADGSEIDREKEDNINAVDGDGVSDSDKHHEKEVLLDSWGLPQSAEATGGDGVVSAEAHHSYKQTMWAVVTVLLLSLIACVVALFLMWRHFKRRLSHHKEYVQEEAGVELLPRREKPPVPAPRKHRLTISEPIPQKPNNEHLANEVYLPVCTDSCAAADSCASAEASGGATGGIPSPSTGETPANNLSTTTEEGCGKDYGKDFGKYARQNSKNINLDLKNKLSQFE